MNNLELYRKGYTVSEITAMNNLSFEEVEEFIKAVDSDSLKDHKILLKNRIIEFYNNGYSVNAISKKTSVSVSIIKDMLKLED